MSYMCLSRLAVSAELDSCIRIDATQFTRQDMHERWKVWTRLPPFDDFSGIFLSVLQFRF